MSAAWTRCADIQVRPACERRLPPLPVLTYFQVRSAPAFAGRSPHKGLRSMKATAGVGRFSETTIFDTACPESRYTFGGAASGCQNQLWHECGIQLRFSLHLI
ncbi:MAG: hypothetical protein E5W38_14945 [Mesorhizobium sp.]|nr:MAG: hypothetical protein E5W38_14945 [Mesorhizobium sp.]